MFNEILAEALELGKQQTKRGKVATYIPELGKANPEQLGLSVFLRDGRRFECGDTTQRFTIQSISKVISLSAALQQKGAEVIFDKIRMEPSGDSFNSLIRLDLSSDYPSNPMINSGALAIVSHLVKENSFDELLTYSRKLCMDEEITLDESVYQSEASCSSRNRAIAYLLKSKGVIDADVEETLDLYIKMCSLSVTANSLAGLGLVLANDGIQPRTGERIISPSIVQTVKTIMMTCGMYDGAGEFAVRVGIPAKSGVGGGILALVNGEMGIGLYGPSLDTKGNSIGGITVLEYLSKTMGLHMFAPKRSYTYI